MTFNISIYNKGNKYKLIDSGTKKADFTDFEFAFEKKVIQFKWNYRKRQFEGGIDWIFKRNKEITL